MRILAILFVTAVLGTSALVPPALAVDTKGYPGGMCQPRSEGFTSHQFLRVGGMLENRAVTPLDLLCPMVKDATNIKKAEVWVIDRSERDGIGCKLSTSNQQGVVLSQESLFTSIAGVNTGGEVLTFGPQKKGPGGYYWLECDVPGNPDPATGAGNSGIIMYNIIEAD